MPRWDPPQGVSPGLTHYIWNKGLKDKGFPAISAAAVSLAVKGLLTLDQTGKQLSIQQTDKPWSASELPAGEAALMRKIADYGGSLTVAVQLETAQQKSRERTTSFPSSAE